jgi:hypothetical protein
MHQGRGLSLGVRSGDYLSIKGIDYYSCIQDGIMATIAIQVL